MSKTIIVFSRLEITGANAQPAWWFVAPPGPTAYVGFGQALALKCLDPQSEDSFIGVGVVVHDYRLLAERIPGSSQWHPHQYRGASLIDGKDYAGISMSLSGQPTVRCDMTVSIAVVLNEGALVDSQEIDRFLSNARIAGGTVNARRNSYRADIENMSQAKQLIRTGYGLHARYDLMKPEVGEDPLDAVLRVTKPSSEKTKPDSWVVPATFGLARVTPVQDRKWTRDDHPHAFAEPLVGLVQLKSLHDSDIPVWRYQERSHGDRVYLVGH